jgi:hypothetical protein
MREVLAILLYQQFSKVKSKIFNVHLSIKDQNKNKNNSGSLVQLHQTTAQFGFIIHHTNTIIAPNERAHIMSLLNLFRSKMKRKR